MTNIPNYLYSLPSTTITPPVQSKVQELPFNQLGWDNFERLTLRYVESFGNAEYCHLYGQPGQKQEGIDLFVRHNSDELFSLYQCKKYKNYTVTDLKLAISTFLKGKWVKKCKNFYICTSSDLTEKKLCDEIEVQAKILKKHNINLLVLDKIKFSNQLKSSPQIVYDFFGLEWVKTFCGEELVPEITDRMSTAEFSQYRKKLGKFYNTLFETHENSINNLAGQSSTPSFSDRYILPDILSNLTLDSINNNNEKTVHEYQNNDLAIDLLDGYASEAERNDKLKSTFSVGSINIESRSSALSWISAKKNTIIVGGAGSGKSALLKYVVLALLDQVEVEDQELLKHKNKLIPVWLPFGYWSNHLLNNPKDSILDCMESWFKGMANEGLWPLMKCAISDQRLLLVVDGLDEWSSEQSASICMQKLTFFIKDKSISSIISSRPTGIELLGLNSQNWSMAELVGLSNKQQEQLIYTCTNYRLNQQNNADTSFISHEVKMFTQELISEISNSRDLSELATVPLMIYMLIHLKTKNVSLPHSRFQVYNELIADLVKVQPKRRKAAAQVIETSSTFSESELIDILAKLAYEIQEKFPHGNIEIEVAEKLISTYLSDETKEFGFGKRESKLKANTFINIGESDVGILVKKSVVDIGFFHRSLQEFLVARHISTLDSSEQKSLISKYIFNHQWKDVLLGFFSLLHKNVDVERLVTHINQIKSTSYNNYAKETLLAEIAFGDNKCSASTAKDIARTVFESIEEEEYLPHREKLLKIALSGYYSNRLHGTILDKINQWMPGKNSWFTNLLEQINEHWDYDDITHELLFSCLNLESISDRRAAANILCTKFNSNALVLSKLFKIAKSTMNASLRYVVSEAIIHGWSNSKEAKLIYNNLKESTNNVSKLICVYYETIQKQTNELSRKFLLDLASNLFSLAYEWKSLIISTIGIGYVDNELKTICINRIFMKFSRPDANLDYDIALSLILNHFITEPYFQECLIEDLQNDRSSIFTSLNFNQKQNNLGKLISSSDKVSNEIENWIYKDGRLDYFLYKYFKSQKMKKYLLKELEKSGSFCFWAAGALLENWGASDEEVITALYDIINSGTDAASNLAHLFPQIYPDKDECYQKLIVLLKQSSKGRRKRDDFIVKGILEMSCDQTHEEVIDILFEKKLIEPDFDENLILFFGMSTNSEKIINLAFEQLTKMEGNIGLVAGVFHQNTDIKRAILNQVKQLPVHLRYIISDEISKMNTDKEIWGLLSTYDEEVDSSTKITSSIGYYSSSRSTSSEEQIKANLQKLQKEITIGGIGHEARRKAALCGYLALNKVDDINSISDPFRKGQTISIPLNESWKEEEVYYSYLVKQWSLLDKNRSSILCINDDKNNHWISLLAPHIKEKSDLANEFKDFLYETEFNFNDRILIAASKIIPKELLLLKMCLSSIGLIELSKEKRDLNYQRDALLAVHILEQQFYNDTRAKNYILELYGQLEKKLDYFLVAAFSIGYLDAPFIKPIKAQLKDSKVWLPAHFHHITQVRGNTKKINQIINCIEYLEKAPKQYSIYFKKLISNLINSSDSLYKEILKRAKLEKSIQVKIHLFLLLESAKGLNKHIKELAIDLYDSQNRKMFPNIVFDTSNGEHSISTMILTGILFNTD